MMSKNLVWAWAIKNIVAILAWMTLAIIFNKWWIALFGILFTSSLSSHGFSRRCDGCGKHSPEATSHDEALTKAKEAGWIHIINGNKDYCPNCKKEINK